MGFGVLPRYWRLRSSQTYGVSEPDDDDFIEVTFRRPPQDDVLHALERGHVSENQVPGFMHAPWQESDVAIVLSASRAGDEVMPGQGLLVHVVLL